LKFRGNAPHLIKKGRRTKLSPEKKKPTRRWRNAAFKEKKNFTLPTERGKDLLLQWPRLMRL